MGEVYHGLHSDCVEVLETIEILKD